MLYTDLLGVTSGVTDSVHDPGDEPQSTEGSGGDGVLQARDEGSGEDDRKHLQGILVSAWIGSVLSLKVLCI